MNPKFQGFGSKSTRAPTPWEHSTLAAAGYDIRKLISFSKVIVDKIEYRSFKINENTKFCNNLLFCDEAGFGIVKSIIEFNHKGTCINGFVIEILKCSKKALQTDYIYDVVETKKHFFVNSIEPIVPALAIRSIFGFRIMKLSNCWETD